MKDGYSKSNPIYTIVVWVVVVVVIAITAIISNSAPTRFANDSNIIYIEQVTIAGQGERNTPFQINMKSGDEVAISFTLPQELGEKQYISYLTGYCIISTEVDGELRYSYGDVMPLPFGRMLGNIRAMVPLQESDAGKTVVVHLLSVYGLTMTLNPFRIGSGSDLYHAILMENIWRMIAVTFFTTLLILGLTIAIHHFLHRRKEIARMYMSLIGFVFCVAVWIICSSDLPQFITDNNAVISLTSFVTLAMMGTCFMSYCYYALPRGKVAFFWTGRLGLLLPLVNILLYVTNIMDPVLLMYVTHVYMGGCVGLCLVNGIRSIRKNLEIRFVIGAVFVVAICSIVALVLFYQNQMSPLPSIVLAGGMGLFVLNLFGTLLMKEEKMIGEQTVSNLYREMAYQDYMTGCGNRAAFELEMERSSTNGASRVSLIMMDLNRLKTTNDELGHQAGDQMILAMSQCITATFEPKGHCYRLGGDEFATILWDCDCMVDDYIEKLHKKVEEYNEEHIIQLSVAVGYANADNPKSKDAFGKIYSAADKNMYYNKMQCHAAMDDIASGDGENPGEDV